MSVYVHVSDLVLFEVTQGLYHNRTTALLLFRVTWSEPHDALGLVDQVLHLPLILHDSLLLFLLEGKGQRSISLSEERGSNSILSSQITSYSTHSELVLHQSDYTLRINM